MGRPSFALAMLVYACGCARDPARAVVGDFGADAAAPPDATVKGELFAFVGSSEGKLVVYAVDPATGAWAFKRETRAGTNPSFAAFDPTRRRVVAVNETEPGLVRSFAFDPPTGALTEISTQAAGGAGSTHVSLDPSAKWVLVANYTSGSTSVLPLDAAGALGNATDTKLSGEKSHWAGTNPSGPHVFVPALGAGVVTQYALDPVSGKLSSNGAASVPAGAGPRHLSFHPSEKWAYVANELDVTVTTLDFDKGAGALSAKQTVSALPSGQRPAHVTGAEIFVHPSGKLVYASTRTFNSVAVFTVDAQNGTLTLVANAPTGGDEPRSFGMDPEGTLLYAANQSAGHVVGFRIEPTTGMLTPLGKIAHVRGPTFVGLARMP